MRKARAKKAFDKARDDADAQRDDRLEKDGLEEGATDVTDQVIIDTKEDGFLTKKRELEAKGYKRQWVGDGKICMAKPKEVKEACKKVNEAPVYGLRPEYDSRQSFHGKANVEVDGKGNETLYSYDTPVAKIDRKGKLTLLPRWDESQTTLRHVKEFLRQHGLKADSLAQIKKDYLNEDFERVDIETDREKMSMTADADGKVTVTTEPKKDEVKEDEEVIVPVDAETKDKIEDNSIDIDFDEFEEETFDELGEGYLKNVYDNVKSYKTTATKSRGNSLVLEGVITFNSGKSKKTSFIFEAKDATKNNKVRFIGENKEITRGRKAFTLVGSVNENKFLSESLNYNYKAKDDEGKSQRVYGTVRKN